jgi:hypothetical protein
MLYLRASNKTVTSGLSVTITRGMLVIVVPKEKEEE